MLERILVAVACAAMSVLVLFSAPVKAEGSLTIRESATLLSSSVVKLTTSYGNSYNYSGVCTASKIGKKTFLTARHCVSNLSANYRVDKDFEYQYVKTILVTVSSKGRSRKEDWAILNMITENTKLKTLRINCTEEIYLGMPVAYAGYPEMINFAFSSGQVTSVNPPDGRGMNSDFAVDLAAAPGASGSPIISLDTGNIIGILTEGVFSSRAGAFMVGIESIANLDLCDPQILRRNSGLDDINEGGPS